MSADTPHGLGPIRANPAPLSPTATPAAVHVLVVDDEPGFRQSLARLLSSRGFRVGTAEDGLSGLAYIEESEPEVVLVDMQMPKMDGFSLLARAKERGARCEIIMMTANDEERHRDAAKLRGVSVFLSKPFAIEQLLTEVDTILNA